MSDVVSLAAERRQRIGKGGARAARRAGRVPAIIYGDNKPPEAISLDPVELQKQLRGHGFFARVFEIDLGGETHRVLARDLQHDPVKGTPMHVDFMRFGAATRVEVEVPVVFKGEGECPGLKKGGMLNIVLHEIPLVCKADAIPESLTVDLSGLEIGDVIHLSAVALPAGAELALADAEGAVATIAAPTVAAVEEEEVEAAAEEAVEPEIVERKGGEGTKE